VLDVGAHVGFFAMHMAALVGSGGSVHAFEPLAENAECLELSVRENRFEDRVTVERKAVGREMGSSELVVAPHAGSTGFAFLSRTGQPLPRGHEVRPVATVTLDDYPLRRPISFIKLDAKGAEPLVVTGAMRVLQEDRPIVLSDLNPLQLERVSRVSSRAFVEQVKALGYGCNELGAGVIGEQLEHVPANGVTSIVFVPRLTVNRGIPGRPTPLATRRP
jgi:FkbM family methyltransferase